MFLLQNVKVSHVICAWVILKAWAVILRWWLVLLIHVQTELFWILHIPMSRTSFTPIQILISLSKPVQNDVWVTLIFDSNMPHNKHSHTLFCTVMDKEINIWMGLKLVLDIYEYICIYVYMYVCIYVVARVILMAWAVIMDSWFYFGCPDLIVLDTLHYTRKKFIFIGCRLRNIWKSVQL